MWSQKFYNTKSGKKIVARRGNKLSELSFCTEQVWEEKSIQSDRNIVSDVIRIDFPIISMIYFKQNVFSD